MSDLVSKIESGLNTVERWESADLLLACRKEIPFHELCPEQFYLPPIAEDAKDEQNKTGPYSKPDDHKYQGDDLLLKRMTIYFQSIMTWVNNPPCELCGCTETKFKSSRGPLTPEERDGEADRVEVYFCQKCNAETTTFPRYNNPKKLLETKKGRCGEYANLFGAFCRSAGFETRYVIDFTDHVWVEVWSNETSRWIMADGCEGKIDEPSMYEKGWGKKLCYNLAFTVDSVADVTMRYTRKFHSDDFQARRRQFSPAGEEQSNMIIAQYDGIIRSKKNLPKTRIEELDRRKHLEKQFLENTLKQDSWGAGAYSEGRLSGSLNWKISRGEAGNNDSNDHDIAPKVSSPDIFHVDCFHPAPYCSESCSIVLSTPNSDKEVIFPQCISVQGTFCGAGLAQSISIVVVDEKYSCILQSRVFSAWVDAVLFLSKLPNERIVAIFADIGIAEADDVLQQSVYRLGNFDIMKLTEEFKCGEHYFLYIGQVNRDPYWATCEKVLKGVSIGVRLDMQTDDKLTGLKLQCEVNSTPQMICTRLPDKYMTLQSQIQADDNQKKEAFVEFINEEVKRKESKYVGFTTKDGTPVYLISNKAFPFKKIDSDVGKSKWKTFFYVPEPMWHKEEVVNDQNETNVDVPLDVSFFSSLFGPNLLRNENGITSKLPTAAALNNTRLIALYFSAHWCPPCRRFTPMLSEMYECLKNEFPTHGLEIVFVSRDRDESSFNLYFRTMPWLSVPWNDQGELRNKLSNRFAVQGIPSLLVLDSISGNIVVTKEQSRNEIQMACQRGEDEIIRMFERNWLQRIPIESKNMMEILNLSCVDNMDCNNDDVSNQYLEINNRDTKYHSPTRTLTKEEQTTKIKDLFTKYVADGMAPNQAAAKAMNLVANELKNFKEEGRLLPGTLKGESTSKVHDSDSPAAKLLSTSLRDVLHTAKKYVENVRKNPYSPKFRSFKVSNRFFDNITSTDCGLEYIVQCLGFRTYSTSTDYIASIPLSVDIDALNERIDHQLSLL